MKNKHIVVALLLLSLLIMAALAINIFRYQETTTSQTNNGVSLFIIKYGNQIESGVFSGYGTILEFSMTFNEDASSNAKLNVRKILTDEYNLYKSRIRFQINYVHDFFVHEDTKKWTDSVKINYKIIDINEKNIKIEKTIRYGERFFKFSKSIVNISP